MTSSEEVGHLAAAARTGDYVMCQMLLHFSLQWVVSQMEEFHMHWASEFLVESVKFSDFN